MGYLFFGGKRSKRSKGSKKSKRSKRSKKSKRSKRSKKSKKSKRSKRSHKVSHRGGKKISGVLAAKRSALRRRSPFNQGKNEYMKLGGKWHLIK